MAVVPSISFERLSCLVFRSTRFSSRSMCTNTSFPTATESVPLCLSDTDRSCASTDASMCRPVSSHRQIRSAWHSSHLPRNAASPSCLSDKHEDLVASEKSDGAKTTKVRHAKRSNPKRYSASAPGREVDVGSRMDCSPVRSGRPYATARALSL
jgi:hypothetical protein